MNESTPAVGEPGPSVVFDKDRADLGFRRWRDHWEKASMDGDIAKVGRVPELSPEASMVLTAIFSASPFRAECVLAEPEFAAGIFKDGPDQVFHGSPTTLRDDLQAGIGSIEIDEKPADRQKTRGAFNRRWRHVGVVESRPGHRRPVGDGQGRIGRGHRLPSPRHGETRPPDARGSRRPNGRIRLCGLGDGETWRERTQLLQRYRSDRSLRPGKTSNKGCR